MSSSMVKWSGGIYITDEVYQMDSAVTSTIMLVAQVTDIEQLCAFIFCTFEKY